MRASGGYKILNLPAAQMIMYDCFEDDAELRAQQQIRRFSSICNEDVGIARKRFDVKETDSTWKQRLYIFLDTCQKVCDSNCGFYHTF